MAHPRASHTLSTTHVSHHMSRNVATCARRKPPDYSSRRSGGQEENQRRRANAHQLPLSARRRVNERDTRDDGGSALRTRSTRGTLYMNPSRRRGRPAHTRSPDDSPLRDGNRDRLIGLLTLRAAKTLEYYLLETNLTYHHWLSEYIKRNPIPLEGDWDTVSGETFLRRLLTAGVDETSYKGGVNDPLFSCVGSIGIDPRTIGQRIMDIRTALAAEFVEDLRAVAEENAILMRESAMASLSALHELVRDVGSGPAGGSQPGHDATPHPEMLDASVTIPDTASEFLSNARADGLEQYQRERERQNEGSGAASSDFEPADDRPRPGLDDINEFESELEALDKWKRRFRILKEDSDASESDAERHEGSGVPSDGDEGVKPDNARDFKSPRDSGAQNANLSGDVNQGKSSGKSEGDGEGCESDDGNQT